MTMTPELLDVLAEIRSTGKECLPKYVDALMNYYKHNQNNSTAIVPAVSSTDIVPAVSSTDIVPIVPTPSQQTSTLHNITPTKIKNVFKFNKNNLLKNDPEFKKPEGFENKNFTSGRLAEMAVHKMFPELTWNNAFSNTIKPDFTHGLLKIDVKSVMTKYNTLVLKERVMNNLCDIYILCDVSETKTKTEYIVEVYGFIVKDNVIKWKKENKPTPIADVGYKIERKFLTPISEINNLLGIQ